MNNNPKDILTTDKKKDLDKTGLGKHNKKETPGADSLRTGRSKGASMPKEADLGEFIQDNNTPDQPQANDTAERSASTQTVNNERATAGHEETITEKDDARRLPDDGPADDAEVSK